jgi:hypothetical protein
MRKRSNRRAGKPPSASTFAQPAPAAIGTESPGVRARQYKVVELSTVDELSLEQAINEWVGQGWKLESIQFAMRESSKRPAMAFVLFTRPAAEGGQGALRSESPRVAGQTVSSDPWRRLRELAGEEPAAVQPIVRRPG